MGTTAKGEVFAGGSLGFAEGQIFASVGAFRGQELRLQPGFEVGQDLPVDFTADIPTRKEWHWKLGAALTVKLK